MKRRWLTWSGIGVLAVLIALALAACGTTATMPPTPPAATAARMTSPPSSSSSVVRSTFGEPAKGGTFRIANTDFAQSDGFDPSGEYFGSAWTIYNSLMLRTLVSYPFTAGPAGNELVARPRHRAPRADRRRADLYTFTLKDGVKFGPPVNRAVTSKDIAYAFQRIATPSVGRPVRQLLPGDQGLRRVLRRQGQDDLGHPDARRQDDHASRSPSPRATSSTAWRCRPPRRSRPRWASATPRPASTAATSSRRGPYMIDGSDKLDISSCALAEADLGLQPEHAASTWCATRTTTPRPTTRRSAQSIPGPLRDLGQHQPRQHLRPRSQRGELEGSFETPAERGPARLPAGPGRSRERLRVNSGDRIWFVYMNLTDAAVRRRPRPQGDEPRHGPRGRPARVGRPGARAASPTDVLPDTLHAASSRRRELPPVPGRRRSPATSRRPRPR